jgi:hypothetical protein
MDHDGPNTKDDPQVLAGEDQGIDASFSVEQVAAAFGVGIQRAQAAVEGEFGGSSTLGSRQAQHLADVLLGDRPQAEREAALMTLGAYTPRHDAAEATAEEKAPGEQSDKMRRYDDDPGEESPRSE